ncbi:MAG: heparinase II/III-family protein [Pseudomonadota bacterium]|nr:heparinase II/III-family protein [Pseudomonadota bacterium]
MAAGIAARLSHPQATTAARWPDATAWWLYGEAGRNRFESTVPAAEPGSAQLEAGGLVVLRDGTARATVDVGPLGFLSLAAHGHADALAVTWTRGGREVVCDPGVGSYFRDAEARNAFRGTGFHATVEVDGSNQSEIGGAFLWTRHANATALGVDLEKRVVFGTHDGYEGLTDPVRHLRAVALLSEQQLLVCDLLEGDGLHVYAQHWPLAPDLEATAPYLGESSTGAIVRLSSSDGEIFGLHIASTTPGEVQLARGHRDPLEGWWSPRLESMRPAWRCTWRTASTGPVALATLITSQEPFEAPIEVSAADRMVKIRLDGCEGWWVDFDRLTIKARQ